MPAQQVSEGTMAIIGTDPAPNGKDAVRELAIKQIERKRHFRMHAVASAALTVLLVVIWATTEYGNAGGWPTDGFSQSSGISHVWNIWIIYPVVGIAFLLAVRAWFTYRKPFISEGEIRREMDRLTGARGGSS